MAGDITYETGVVAGSKAQEPDVPNAVTARYRVRVERLDEGGVACGRVVEVVAPLRDEQLVAIYGERLHQYREPEELAFIGGLPGELVDVELRWPLPRPGRKPARRVPAPNVRFVEVIEAAPGRVTPRCSVFGRCGGCQLQHMSYPEQLAWKTARMRTLFADVGFTEPPVLPAIGCAPPWNYRNHMRFSVNRRGEPGLTVRGTSHVLPLRECPHRR